jgi:hypothetical protein
MARAALTAANVPLLPTGADSGAGVFVHPVDGDQYQVRIAAWAGGHHHKPHPGDTSQDGAAWLALMHQVLNAMAAVDWHQTSGVIHDCAQYVVPADANLPERPTPVLGCDPEEDDFVHQVARILRAQGYMPLAAFNRLEGPAWGFQVSSASLASDHRRPAPADAPYRPEELPKVHAMLAAYRRTLSREGMTCADTDDDRTTLWVRRPARSTRARIVLADDTGFAWLPDLAATYRRETRLSTDEPWQPQGEASQDSMLWTVERGLRRGWATAEADDGTLYVTLTDPCTEFAAYSRYVPFGTS